MPEVGEIKCIGCDKEFSESEIDFDNMVCMCENCGISLSITEKKIFGKSHYICRILDEFSGMSFE